MFRSETEESFAPRGLTADLFGAHTVPRLDREGVCHHGWPQA